MPWLSGARCLLCRVPKRHGSSTQRGLPPAAAPKPVRLPSQGSLRPVIALRVSNPSFYYVKFTTAPTRPPRSPRRPRSNHDTSAQQGQQGGAAAGDSSTVASRSASISEPTSSLDPLAYRSAEAWGLAPLLRLYVVQYSPEGGSSSSSGSSSTGADASPPAAGLLVSAVSAAGGSVLSYVPDSSLLVVALPEAAAAVQRDTGAVMVGAWVRGGAWAIIPKLPPRIHVHVSCHVVHRHVTMGPDPPIFMKRDA